MNPYMIDSILTIYIFLSPISDSKHLSWTMYYVFKSDNPPAWLDHLGTVCGTVTLASEDGHQVSVSTAILLAMSPLVRSILSDIHPADYGPLVMVFAVCGDVLRVVGEILSKGEVNVKDERFEGEVQLFFKRIGVELFLNCTKVEVIKSDLVTFPHKSQK